MPRVTKAMLEKQISYLRRTNLELTREMRSLKEMNQILMRKDFDVDAFCRMHAEGITALSHALTDLRIIIQKLH